jgi:hypothetical protein
MTRIDAFALLCLQLSGRPIPDLPSIAGRKYCAPKVTEADPIAEAWDATHAEADADDTIEETQHMTLLPRAPLIRRDLDPVELPLTEPEKAVLALFVDGRLTSAAVPANEDTQHAFVAGMFRLQARGWVKSRADCWELAPRALRHAKAAT